MAKKQERGPRGRTNISAKAMREYAAALHKIAEIHEKIADWMGEDQTVDATGLKQTLEGYTRISGFLGSVVSAYADQTLAAGIAELAGAVATLRVLTKRLPHDNSPPKFPGNKQAEIKANVNEAINGPPEKKPR